MKGGRVVHWTLNSKVRNDKFDYKQKQYARLNLYWLYFGKRVMDKKSIMGGGNVTSLSFVS